MLYFFIRCCLFSFLYSIFLHSLLLVLCCLFSFLYSIFFSFLVAYSRLFILYFFFPCCLFSLFLHSLFLHLLLLVLCPFLFFRNFLLLIPVSLFSISPFSVVCSLSPSLVSLLPVAYPRFFILYCLLPFSYSQLLPISLLLYFFIPQRLYLLSY